MTSGVNSTGNGPAAVAPVGGSQQTNAYNQEQSNANDAYASTWGKDSYANANADYGNVLPDGGGGQINEKQLDNSLLTDILQAYPELANNQSELEKYWQNLKGQVLDGLAANWAETDGDTKDVTQLALDVEYAFTQLLNVDGGGKMPPASVQAQVNKILSSMGPKNSANLLNYAKTIGDQIKREGGVPGSSAGASSASSQAVNDLWNTARGYLQQNNYHEAYAYMMQIEERYHSSLAQDPDIYFWMGYSAQQMGQTQDALRWYQELSDANENIQSPADPKDVAFARQQLQSIPNFAHSNVQNQNAYTAYQSKNYDGSWYSYDQVIRNNPEYAQSNPNIYYMAANAALSSKNPQIQAQAKGLFEKYVQSGDNNPQAMKYAMEQVSGWDAGQYQQNAINAFQKAIDTLNTPGPLHNSYAPASQQFTNVINSYSSYAQQSPLLYYYAAISQITLGHLQQGKEYAEKMLEIARGKYNDAIKNKDYSDLGEINSNIHLAEDLLSQAEDPNFISRLTQETGGGAAMATAMQGLGGYQFSLYHKKPTVLWGNQEDLPQEQYTDYYSTQYGGFVSHSQALFARTSAPELSRMEGIVQKYAGRGPLNEKDQAILNEAEEWIGQYNQRKAYLDAGGKINERGNTTDEDDNVSGNQLWNEDEAEAMGLSGSKMGADELFGNFWGMATPTFHWQAVGKNYSWGSKTKPIQLYDYYGQIDDQIKAAYNAGNIALARRLQAEEYSSIHWGATSVTGSASVNFGNLEYQDYEMNWGMGQPDPNNLANLMGSGMMNGIQMRADAVDAEGTFEVAGGGFKLNGQQYNMYDANVDAQAALGLQIDGTESAMVSGGGTADMKAGGGFFLGGKTAAFGNLSVGGLSFGAYGALAAGYGANVGLEAGWTKKGGWDFGASFMPPDIIPLTAQGSAFLNVNSGQISAEISWALNHIHSKFARGLLSAVTNVGGAAFHIAADAGVGAIQALSQAYFGGIGDVMNNISRGNSAFGGLGTDLEAMSAAYHREASNGNYLAAIGEGAGYFLKTLGDLGMNTLVGGHIADDNTDTALNASNIAAVNQLLDSGRITETQAKSLESSSKYANTVEQVFNWVPIPGISGGMKEYEQAKQAKPEIAALSEQLTTANNKMNISKQNLKLYTSQLKNVQNEIKAAQASGNTASVNELVAQSKNISAEIVSLQSAVQNFTLNGNSLQSQLTKWQGAAGKEGLGIADMATMGIASSVANAWNSTKAEFADTTKSVESEFKSAGQNISDGNVGDFFEGLAQGAWGVIKGAGEYLGEAVETAGKAAANWIKKIWGSIFG